MAILNEVVKLAGLALQAEDCAIRAGLQSRQEHGGLTRLRNERYYQFIVWRAALPKWHAEVERRTHDLILRVDHAEHIFEMKNWRGWNEGNWRKIQEDVSKLCSPEIRNAYVIVFSDNPPDKTEENYDFLKNKLTGIAWPQIDYRFITENPDGSAAEFWIAGWSCLRT